ncbi:MAG: hypothetical protein MHM6MM_007454 [Cercozoa sp. M6MM]
MQLRLAARFSRLVRQRCRSLSSPASIDELFFGPVGPISKHTITGTAAEDKSSDDNNDIEISNVKSEGAVVDNAEKKPGQNETVTENSVDDNADVVNYPSEESETPASHKRFDLPDSLSHEKLVEAVKLAPEFGISFVVRVLELCLRRGQFDLFQQVLPVLTKNNVGEVSSLNVEQLIEAIRPAIDRCETNDWNALIRCVFTLQKFVSWGKVVLSEPEKESVEGLQFSLHKFLECFLRHKGEHHLRYWVVRNHVYLLETLCRRFKGEKELSPHVSLAFIGSIRYIVSVLEHLPPAKLKLLERRTKQLLTLSDGFNEEPHRSMRKHARALIRTLRARLPASSHTASRRRKRSKQSREATERVDSDGSDSMFPRAETNSENTGACPDDNSVGAESSAAPASELGSEVEVSVM